METNNRHEITEKYSSKQDTQCEDTPIEDMTMDEIYKIIERI